MHWNGPSSSVAAPCAPWHCVRGPVRKCGVTRPFNRIVSHHTVSEPIVLALVSMWYVGGGVLLFFAARQFWASSPIAPQVALTTVIFIAGFGAVMALPLLSSTATKAICASDLTIWIVAAVAGVSLGPAVFAWRFGFRQYREKV